MRCNASYAKLCSLAFDPFLEVVASVKGLSVQVLMEIDAAQQRQFLLQGLLEKAAALFVAEAGGGLMARRQIAFLTFH